MMYNGSSLYGNYRTRSFTQIYPSVEHFIDDYKTLGVPQKITEENAQTLYYLLYARYGNSHISSSDENRFRFDLLSIIFSYGPAWEKRMDIQEKLRSLTEADILKGSKAIYNKAYNDGSPPSTATLEEITTINEQNTANYKKSKLEGYAMLYSLIESDVTEEFIRKFSRLFLSFATPELPLWYENEEDDENG